MIQEMMSLHSKVSIVSYSPHTFKETHHWLKASVILNSDKRLFYESKIYSGYGNKSNARILVKSFLEKNIKNYDISSDDKKIIFDGWEALCDKFAKPVFFEKSPQYLNEWAALSLILEWMSKTNFDVKIIGLVRNPVGVINSAKKLFGSKPKVRQYRWLNTYKNLIVFKSLIKENQFKLVKYEDIVVNPNKIANEICDFIGINYEKNMIINIINKQNKVNNIGSKFKLDKSVELLARFYGYTDKELKFIYSEDNLFNQKSLNLILPLKKIKNIIYYRFFVPLKEKISIIINQPKD